MHPGSQDPGCTPRNLRISSEISFFYAQPNADEICPKSAFPEDKNNMRTRARGKYCFAGVVLTGAVWMLLSEEEIICNIHGTI